MMSDLVRVPKNVTVESGECDGDTNIALSWNCVEMFNLDQHEAQAVIDLLVHESELEQQVSDLTAALKAVEPYIESTLQNADDDESVRNDCNLALKALRSVR